PLRPAGLLGVGRTVGLPFGLPLTFGRGLVSILLGIAAVSWTSTARVVRGQRVLHTAGHRAELISILIANPPRSPKPSMVLTGDSLLVGDVGRPDFGGGDAAAQFDSLTRLLRLPEWVAVFPGHFEGPCGKGMCGRPSTTWSFERLDNPLA